MYHAPLEVIGAGCAGGVHIRVERDGSSGDNARSGGHCDAIAPPYDVILRILRSELVASRRRPGVSPRILNSNRDWIDLTGRYRRWHYLRYKSRRVRERNI